MRTSVAAVCMLLASCALSLAHAQDEATVKLTFAWPERGEARVREVSLKKGNEAESHYTLRIAPDKADGSIIVTYHDVKVVRVNDQDLTQPQYAKLQASISAVAQLMPPMRISKTGEFIDFVDFDAAIDRILDRVFEMRETPAEKAEEARRTMRSPALRAMLNQKLREPWVWWVEAWIDFEGEVGAVYEGERDFPVPSTTKVVKSRFELHVIEKVKDKGADCLRLEMHEVCDGEQYRRGIESMMANLPNPISPGSVKSATRTTDLTGLYEIATLLPHAVTFTAVAEVEVAGEGKRSEVEKQSYLFEWLLRVDDPEQPR